MPVDMAGEELAKKKATKYKKGKNNNKISIITLSIMLSYEELRTKHILSAGTAHMKNRWN